MLALHDAAELHAQAGELPLPAEICCYAPALVSSLAIKDAAGLLPRGLLATAALRLMPALLQLSNALRLGGYSQGKSRALSGFQAATGVTPSFLGFSLPL